MRPAGSPGVVPRSLRWRPGGCPGRVSDRGRPRIPSHPAGRGSLAAPRAVLRVGLSRRGHGETGPRGPAHDPCGRPRRAHGTDRRHRRKPAPLRGAVRHGPHRRHRGPRGRHPEALVGGTSVGLSGGSRSGRRVLSLTSRIAGPVVSVADVSIGQTVAAESPKEACGLFGVWAPGEDVARLTFFGLFALQHRGQESAGMAVADGERIVVYRELGLVSQVFDEGTLSTLQGDLCVGHTRYSTTGSTTWDNAQPTFKTNGTRGLALGHNGNLVNTSELAIRVGQRSRASSDTDLVATLLARHLDRGLEQAAMEILPTLAGAFSFVMMDERTVYGARDPHGIRPLSIGRLGSGFCLASETCALDVVGATFVRDVEPGELVSIDQRGIHSSMFAESPTRALCLFEFVYLSRPDSRMYGKSVHEARREMGRRLAAEAPVKADLVIPIPDTGHSAAQGFAEASGIAYGEGLMKNRYIGRTFIEPTPALRSRGVKLKLNPLPDAIRGK